MSQQGTLYHWFGEIAHHIICLKKPQLLMLATASLGLALAERCTLTRVAKALPSQGKIDTMERRLQRFLSNRNIEWVQCSQALAAWVISSLTTDVVVLLVDETSLKERLKVMAVSLAYRGRAIPLAWWCYPQEKWPMAQVKLIMTLLQWVQQGIPKGKTVLVEADRGIGTSPRLLKAIEAMGWYYLVRVQSGVRLALNNGRVVSFRRLAPKCGIQWQGKVRAFQKAGWLPCWAVAVWERGHAEPWLLLTNYSEAQSSWYGIRMWEEAAFKDFKSSGWQWQRSHVWNPDHANKLWLVMALAYVWAVSLGTWVLSTAKLFREICRGRKKRCSVLQLGLRLLHRFVALGRKLVYQLLLSPYPILCAKTVVY